MCDTNSSCVHGTYTEDCACVCFPRYTGVDCSVHFKEILGTGWMAFHATTAALSLIEILVSCTFLVISIRIRLRIEFSQTALLVILAFGALGECFHCLHQAIDQFSSEYD